MSGGWGITDLPESLGVLRVSQRPVFISEEEPPLPAGTVVPGA